MLSKKPKSQFSLEFSCKKGEIIAILHHNSIEIEQKSRNAIYPKIQKSRNATYPKIQKSRNAIYPNILLMLFLESYL